MKDGATQISVNIPTAVFLQKTCQITWKGQRYLGTRTSHLPRPPVCEKGKHNQNGSAPSIL